MAAQPGAGSSPGRCKLCAAPAKKVCSLCKDVNYCGQACQRKDWKEHKKICRPATSSVATVTALPLCGVGYRRRLAATGGLPSALVPLRPPHTGLLNPDTRCYLNSILQCLAHTPLLLRVLDAVCPKGSMWTSQQWLIELVTLLRRLKDPKTSAPVSAMGIQRLVAEHSAKAYNGGGFGQGQQADAHDALMIILEHLTDDCLALGEEKAASAIEKLHLENSSVVLHTFGLEKAQVVECASCSYRSVSTTVGNCLELTCTADLDRSYFGQQGDPRSRKVAPDIELTALLTEFSKRERIDDYKCDECKAKGCFRFTQIRRPPNVLVAYINRQANAGLFGKVSRRVTFTASLNIDSFLEERAEAHVGYSLYAVVVHRDMFGSTFFGHYVTYIRIDRSDQWYLLDDGDISTVSFEEVQRQHAYLLFYSRDIELPPFGSVPESSEGSKQPDTSKGAKTMDSSGSEQPSTGSGSNRPDSRGFFDFENLD